MSAVTTGIVVLGAVAGLGLATWLYGRAQRRLGSQTAHRSQARETADARERMADVEPDGERSTAERLRDGEF